MCKGPVVKMTLQRLPLVQKGLQPLVSPMFAPVRGRVSLEHSAENTRGGHLICCVCVWSWYMLYVLTLF